MLMAANVPLVHTIALKVSARLPRHAIVEHGDLLSEGTFGLRRAILAFDPSRGVKFATYASQRVHGAILDGLREMDHVPRLMRRRGLAPNLSSIDAELPGTNRGESLGSLIVDRGNRFNEIDEEDQFSGMLRGLSESERAIMQMYYADNIRMSDIGQMLGLSESRISQMHDNILARIKAKIVR